MDLSVLNKALSIKTGNGAAGAQASSLEQGERVIDLELDKISADPNQPRKEFDTQSIKELADDIKRNGLIQPVIVRQDGIGRYVLVAGERRLKAYALLGEKTIKAIVRAYAADQLGYIQIAENVKRSDLKYYEIAEFIISKVNEGESNKDVAEKLGLSKSDISRFLIWGEAPDFMRAAKDKFSSIRTFYELCNLCEEHKDEVESFVSGSDDHISWASARAFKNSLLNEGAEESTQGATENGQEPQAEASEGVIAIDETVDQTDEHAPDYAQEQSSDNANETTEQSTSESEDDTPPWDVDSSNDEQSTSQSEDEAESGYEEQAEVSEVEYSPEVADDYEEQQESNGTAEFEDEVGPKKFKRPVIIGSVEGREATLEYRMCPSTDGMIVVKYEDGSEDEIEAGRFRINRIFEE